MSFVAGWMITMPLLILVVLWVWGYLMGDPDE